MEDIKKQEFYPTKKQKYNVNNANAIFFSEEFPRIVFP